MEIILVRYGANLPNDGWWTGYDLYNNSPHWQEVEVKVEINGEIADCDYATLPPFRHATYVPDKIGIHALLIKGGDDLLVTQSIAKTGSGLAVNYCEDLECRLSRVIEKVDSMTSWGPKDTINHAWIFGGNTNCSWLPGSTRNAVRLVMESIYYDFPDRPDRRIVVSDNNPNSGSCPGHPSNSHRGSDMDFDYYTHGPTNCTQTNTIVDKTIIWDGDTLLASVFDWKRNWAFVRRVKGFMAQASFSMDIRLKDFIKEMVRTEYGSQEAQKVDIYIIGDDPGEYHHDTHCHAALGGVIDWDFSVLEWDLMEAY